MDAMDNGESGDLGTHADGAAGGGDLNKGEGGRGSTVMAPANPAVIAPTTTGAVAAVVAAAAF